jgi:hypothetical protein
LEQIDTGPRAAFLGGFHDAETVIETRIISLRYEILEGSFERIGGDFRANFPHRGK